MRRLPLALWVGGALTLLFFGLAALSVVWTPFDVTKLIVSSRLKPPGAPYLFGTDHFGRDVFSMVMVGARTSIMV
jgi:peptide/nickel transport system permease protein